ncbi:large conductance mechanosensitive channel protein MscL [Mesoterricola sediminis]|uniref:Large-conductance mechanosensitive channel n=1 Tax=Mesoterricola sediminis TaxID=2927980 RepID=A0AA48KH13_9BACT|nr:large conductance mechanosensitive channel protein MscL [Mesoterricola sediminis]BDU77933.1 large-conductance mechanosensitive channel [Mesoterricola sediminis]
MSLLKDFKAFIARGNVVDLAVAVVVGGSFQTIVKAFVSGIIMPIVSYVMPPEMAWEEWTLGRLRIGLVLGDILNFLITSAVVFLLFVKSVALIKRLEGETPPPPTTKTCPECRETIPIEATRCKFCTSKL